MLAGLYNNIHLSPRGIIQKPLHKLLLYWSGEGRGINCAHYGTKQEDCKAVEAKLQIICFGPECKSEFEEL